MSRKFLVSIDLTKNQILNAVLHVVAGTPSTPVAGQIWYDSSGTARMRYYNGTTNLTPWVDNVDIPDGTITNVKLATNPLARANHTGTQAAATISDFDTQVRTSRLDQMAAPTATVSMGSQIVSNVATPVAGTDAANKNYVDTAVTGLSWKQAVRVATTANGTLATAFANGQTVDGVTLVTGNRILLKNQSAGAENGIYTVNASGAPTRASDADTSAELQGLAVMVQEGTTNQNTQWIQTVDGTITVGTTALVFAQFGGGAAYTAGNGLTLTANDFAVGAGTGITVAADSVAIDTAVVVRKFAVSVGNGSLTTIGVTHNLGTTDVIVEVFEIATGETVICDVVRTSTNALNVIFSVAPTTNQYRVVVHA
jgi:hypothetical protein